MNAFLSPRISQLICLLKSHYHHDANVESPPPLIENEGIPTAHNDQIS